MCIAITLITNIFTAVSVSGKYFALYWITFSVYAIECVIIQVVKSKIEANFFYLKTKYIS